MQKCTKCGISQPLDRFHRNRTRKSGHQSECTNCSKIRGKIYYAKYNIKERAKLWRQNNKKKISTQRRLRYLKNKDKHFAQQIKRNFGLDMDTYLLLRNKQNNSCAICHKEQLRRRLNIDHNHKNNLIRGLLCDGCNIALGLLKDNIELLRSAITYLETTN